MLIFLTTLLTSLASIFRSRASLGLENLALRHQIGVLHRSAGKRPKLTAGLRAVPRQNLEAHLKSTRCKRGCVTHYMCPAGAVMGQDEVFGRHNSSGRMTGNPS